MSQNTNHIPTSPKIEEALLGAVKSREYNLYPYGKGLPGLPELVVSDLKLRAEDGWAAHVAHGGLESLYVMNRALLKPGDEVVASDPSFLPIHNQIALSGAKAVELPIYAAPWKLTPGAVRAAITPRTRMLLLIDPINPLGTQYTRDEVRQMAEIANERDLVLVHDITYHDFAFDPALAGEWAPDRTIYAYSFSKNCGFAGMRIGALVAKPPLLDKIRPFFVNTLGTNILAQRAAKAALETKKEWIGRVVQISRDNQRQIVEAVRKIHGLFVPVYPSSSNTLCIDVSGRGIDPDAFERTLLYDHGVFVRSGTYLSPRFGKDFVRVSFSVEPEGVARFTKALPEVVEKLATK